MRSSGSKRQTTWSVQPASSEEEQSENGVGEARRATRRIEYEVTIDELMMSDNRIAFILSQKTTQQLVPSQERDDEAKSEGAR
jgi:hypothetical protein